MSNLIELQNALKEYKADQTMANQLRDLKLTPGWKAVIEEGLINQLSKATVIKLANATTEEKENCLGVLMGISSLEQYLIEILAKGELAKDRIYETEYAITELTKTGET